MRRLALLVALIASTGCSVSSLEGREYEQTKNSCAEDSDCGSGTCNESIGVCVASEGQFENVLFEVTPPSNAKEYGGLSFLVPTTLPKPSGTFDVDLGVVATVKGSVIPTTHVENCVSTYGATKSLTAPVKVTLTPSARALGLPSPQYSAKTSFNSETNSFEFEAWVPPDEYDVYVEADTTSTDITSSSCPIVPQLSRHAVKEIYEIPPQLEPPSVLHLDVLWPADNVQMDEETPLTGWTVDVLDPATGRVLSAPTKLTYMSDSSDPANQHYLADVEYNKVVGKEQTEGTELVRIKPPDGSTAPTLVFERSALELFQAGEGRIDQLQDLPDPAKLTDVLLVTSDGDPTGISGSIHFISTKLDNASPNNKSYFQPGTQASFERKVKAIGGVVEEVDLLPGEYEVMVSPEAATGYALTRQILFVAPSEMPQGGKTLVVEKVSQIGGSVLVPTGSGPASGAAVQAVASPMSPSPFDLAVGTSAFKPEADQAVVGSSGTFALNADPGTLDFSVRPADSTAFAWLVRPNVEVQSGIHDLGEMKLPLPVLYQGSVTVPSAGVDPSTGTVPTVTVPGSLIRAYIYLNASGYTPNRDGAKAVVQIAETRVSSDGTFRLFLPSHLN